MVVDQVLARCGLLPGLLVVIFHLLAVCGRWSPAIGLALAQPLQLVGYTRRFHFLFYMPLPGQRE